MLKPEWEKIADLQGEVMMLRRKVKNSIEAIDDLSGTDYETINLVKSILKED